MQHYKAIIVDDEEDGREMIRFLLAELFPTIEVAASCDAHAEAYHAICNDEPDILFLDVEMQGSTGFDLLSKLSLSRAQLIFVTAHEQYSIQAIKASAVDYLLKPVNKTEFKNAVTRALEKAGRPQPGYSGQEALIQLNQRLQIRRIMIPTLTGFSFIDTDRIVYCEAFNNYTIFHLTDKTKLTVSRTLYEYEKELSIYGFIRIHHKYLVNLKQVIEYAKGKGGGSVMMSNGSQLEVSVRKKADLIKSVMNQVYKKHPPFI
jgi:two-component system LytT family response regulator